MEKSCLPLKKDALWITIIALIVISAIFFIGYILKIPFVNSNMGQQIFLIILLLLFALIGIYYKRLRKVKTGKKLVK